MTRVDSIEALAEQLVNVVLERLRSEMPDSAALLAGKLWDDAIASDYAGFEARVLEALALHVATPADRERAKQLQEGERNDAEFGYFEVRHEFNNAQARKLFCDGFNRGYSAAIGLLEGVGNDKTSKC